MSDDTDTPGRVPPRNLTPTELSIGRTIVDRIMSRQTDTMRAEISTDDSEIDETLAEWRSEE